MYKKSELDSMIEHFMSRKIPPINLAMLYGAMGISSNTFDKYYPIGGGEREQIVARINGARGGLAFKKFQQIFNSEEPALQIAAAKMVSEEMRIALTQRNTDITTGGSPIALTKEAEDNIKAALGMITDKEL